MKNKLDNVGNVILDLKTFQQERQAQLANQVPIPPETFQEGQLVYLLAPSAATLRTNTQKCRADFIGPLVINKALDSIHYTINDLQGRILISVYHINRLKKATVRTPSCTVSIYQQLHDSFTHTSEEAATPATYFLILPQLQYFNPFTLYHTSILLDVHFWIQFVNAYWIQSLSTNKGLLLCEISYRNT